MRLKKANVFQVAVVGALALLATVPALAQLSADDFLPPRKRRPMGTAPRSATSSRRMR